MQISVNTLCGDTITLDAEPTDTIENVKAKILDKKFSPPMNMKWNLVYNCEQLEDGRTLNDYNVENQSILNMNPMVFLVKSPKGFFTFRQFNPWDSIESVKNVVREKTGIPIEEMKLVYQSKQLVDDRTLGEYKIANFSTIHALYRLRCFGECNPRRICVKNISTNELITLEVTLLDSVESVKAKILDQTGIQRDQQQLTFADKQLKDSDRLMDCGIETESTLHLDILPVE